MKLKNLLKNFLHLVKIITTFAFIIGFIFMVRWWGIKGMIGFIIGSFGSIVLLMKRNEKFTIIYKLIGGDKQYTRMLLGQKEKVDRTKDIYSEE